MIENNVDILPIMKARLPAEHDESDIISALIPSRYSFTHTPRKGRTSGGVGILMKTNIAHKVNSLYSFKRYECQEMVLTFHHLTVRLRVLYRPPKIDGSTIGNFFHEFGHYLGILTLFPESLLIPGYFNVHLDKSDLLKLSSSTL